MSDASDPVRFFRQDGKKKIGAGGLSPQTRLDVYPICSSPGTIPSAIRTAADACHTTATVAASPRDVAMWVVDWQING